MTLVSTGLGARNVTQTSSNASLVTGRGGALLKAESGFKSWPFSGEVTQQQRTSVMRDWWNKRTVHP